MTGPAPLHAELACAPEGGEAYWTTTSDGLRLRIALWRQGTRGTAVIFPGRTEYVEKYGPVITGLSERGFAVLAIDWRGQGLSERNPNTPDIGYVEDFRDYQKDVAAALDLAAREELPRPMHMVAHSMGGCIGLRTLLERGDFSSAVMSAPMWHLQMRAATRELTSKMTRLANLVGLGYRKLPGANTEPTARAVSFEANSLTSHRPSFDWMLGQITARPELSLGGPSLQWTYAALEEMARLYVAPLPRIPIMAFLGSDEDVVSTSVIRSQLKKMELGTLIELEGAKHEVFMETPDHLDTVWDSIDDFLPGAA